MTFGSTRRSRPVSARASVEICEPRRLFAAVTYLVTNPNDSGAGSLRQAIIDANAHANDPAPPEGEDGRDRIAFDIAGADRTIDLISALPNITDPVILGLTADLNEPSAPLAELNGVGAGASTSGIVVSSDSFITGIAVSSFRQDGIRVLGNRNTISGAVHVGTDIAGTGALGNSGNGILVQGNDNVISRVRIVFNGGAGIAVTSGTGNDLSFVGQAGAIRSNGGLGIDLGPTGAATNDAGDTDTGANNLQNYPVLTAVTFSGGKATVTGTINTLPNATVLLDFFANPIAAREGWQALTQRDDGGTPGDPSDDTSSPPSVVTNASGNANFTFTLEGAPANGGSTFGTVAASSFITATATAESTFDTSEFSAPLGAAAAPRVQQVFVRGSTWQSAFGTYLQNRGLGSVAYGFAIPATDQLNELPWTNLNQVSIQFTEPVTVPAASLAIRGVNVPNYVVGAPTYNAVTMTATWQLGSVVTADKLLLDLAATVTDGTNALDGEWTTGADTYPSGNGTAGGNFRFRMNVLPGDVNRSGGEVDGADVIQVRNRQFTDTGTPGTPPNLYTAFHDVNGNGLVDGQDVILVRNRQFTALPAGEPSATAAARTASFSAAQTNATALGKAVSDSSVLAFGTLRSRLKADISVALLA